MVALDVLELRADRAGDDDIHLLRNTAGVVAQEERPGTQLRRVPLPQRGTSSDYHCSSARPAAGLVALRRVQRLFLVWVCFSPVCADSETTRSQSSRGVTLSVEVGHYIAWLLSLLVPLHALHNHHPHPAVAGHSRFRSRPDWSRDYLECGSDHPDCLHCRAFAFAKTRSTLAVRGGACLYGICCLAVLAVHDGVGGGELLPHGIARRCGTSFCFHRPGRLHCAAGNLHWRPGQT